MIVVAILPIIAFSIVVISNGYEDITAAISPDQTRLDQTKPDHTGQEQTTLDQTRPRPTEGARP